MKFDLAFGNSVAVRTAFMEAVGVPGFFPNDGHRFSFKKMMEMDYPAFSGDPELVEITKQVIDHIFQTQYKHVFITNGATGGVVIALRAYRQQGRDCCRTRTAPWYGRYPGMIKAAGMRHASQFYEQNAVILLDLPGNPTGAIDQIYNNFAYPVILDAVYYNNVYAKGFLSPVPHDVLVGSFSKLFGLNGIRMGWIATNDDLLAVRINELITAEYCGLSAPSAFLIKESWPRLQWHYFEQMSNIYLNGNREEWSKLTKFLGDVPVPPVGMFHYAPMDAACKKLFEKAGVLWTNGNNMGTDDNFGRFNIGQDMRLIDEAVAAVLKEDRIY